ncbi:MAG: LPS assembly lipoprotein LptE [Notoacmeibacter sp.]
MSLKQSLTWIIVPMALSACTVQPLYQTTVAPAQDGAILDASAATSMSMQSTLSTVAIKPVGTRAAQIVRNKMIFLFGQGKGEPKAPAYSLALTISQVNEGVALVQGVDLDANQPTASALTMTGAYVLTDTTGAVIAKGTRRATANYDVPTQGFASRAALLDAEDRAANELGEILHLAIAQAFASKN